MLKKAWDAGSNMHGNTLYSDGLRLIYNDIVKDRELNPNKPIKPISLLFFTDGGDNSKDTSKWAEKLAEIGVYINLVIVNDRYDEETRYERVKTGRQIEVKKGIWFFGKTEVQDEYERKPVVVQNEKFADLERLYERAKGFFLRNVSLSYIPVSYVNMISEEELVDLIINDEYRAFVQAGTDKGFRLKTPAQLGM